MDLREELGRIASDLRTGRFTSEAQVSQGIVRRLLHALGWPTFDVRVVIPEYQVDNGRVDFALCHPPTRAAVFVEVKRVGNSSGADRQLFQYAFHLGVPLAVLTDGQEWSIYLPAQQGQYQDRRLIKLDLLEGDIDELARRLSRYLSYGRVCSGEALSSANADFGDVFRVRAATNALPDAWRRLVSEPDSLLVELLSDAVENLCGFKPDTDTVASFISAQGEGPRTSPPVRESRQSTTAGSRASSPNPNLLGLGNGSSRREPPPNTAGELPRSSTPIVPMVEAIRRSVAQETATGRQRFELRGAVTAARSAKDVMVGVLRALAAEDPTFLARMAARPKHGRLRRYVALSREELYPEAPHLVDFSEELVSGWWVGTNYNKGVIARIIEMACEVANIRHGIDLKVVL